MWHICHYDSLPSSLRKIIPFSITTSLGYFSLFLLDIFDSVSNYAFFRARPKAKAHIAFVSALFLGFLPRKKLKDGLIGQSCRLSVKYLWAYPCNKLCFVFFSNFIIHIGQKLELKHPVFQVKWDKIRKFQRRSYAAIQRKSY
jgi:hypothetical protein